MKDLVAIAFSDELYPLIVKPIKTVSKKMTFAWRQEVIVCIAMFCIMFLLKRYL